MFWAAYVHFVPYSKTQKATLDSTWLLYSEDAAENCKLLE